MSLSETQKKHLRGLGHRLKPTVMIGDAGVTDSLFAEFESTLTHHELIKIKVRVGDRSQRDAIMADLCERSGGEMVQRIGNVALIYWENPERRRIVLPSR